MRTILKVLRVENHLTQDEMAKKVGVSRPTYAAVENGQLRGSEGFWKVVQGKFEIPDEKMWELMRDE